MKHINSEHIRLLTFTGVLTALTTVATLVIRIPTPSKGYINLGDTLVNLCAWILGSGYGAFAAGFGSALADLISGYAIYAPATFVIKFLMALVSFEIFHVLEKKFPSLSIRIFSTVVAELIMIVGYALFAGILYGSMEAAWVSIPENAVQGIFGAGASIALYELILKRIPQYRKK
ncbi:MAG: ECF transporter S component [Oscillospiraceae bacterium]|nr:ECF transporter S component [Oscillospiraceae bacterium]